MTFFLISQCRFSDLPKSTAVFILGKKMKKINFSKSIFFSYLSAGFQICDVVWAMNDFWSQNLYSWLLYLVKFFSKVRLFSTLVKNQSSETAVPYKTAVLFTLYGCFLHLVKNHFFQNSRTKQPYFSLCLHVRLFQHLVKIKKINFLKINFFKYLYTLHSTLYTLHLAECGRVKSTAVFSNLKKIEPKLSKLWFETNQWSLEMSFNESQCKNCSVVYDTRID